MNQPRSRRHHIDTAISSDCSQNSHRLGHKQSDYHRNNHNSNFIPDNELIQSTSAIGLRKRRTNLPCTQHHQRSPMLLSSTHLILLRLMILFILSLLFYYGFSSIYPKPKRRGWESVWHMMIDWLTGE